MNLEDYIKWHRDLGHDGLYDKSPELADPNAVSFKHIGNVDLPDVEHVYEKSFMVHWRGGKRGYLSAYDDKLTEWAKKRWPALKFVKDKIQIQRPGGKVQPHLDLLGDYLSGVCDQIPWLKKVKHSLDKPGVDVHQMLIALDDQVDGQIFAFSDKNWNWKKGDCIRVNNWQALHWTENKSEKDRAIIKVQGINFGMKKESNIIS